MIYNRLPMKFLHTNVDYNVLIMFLARKFSLINFIVKKISILKA